MLLYRITPLSFKSTFRPSFQRQLFRLSVPVFGLRPLQFQKSLHTQRSPLSIYKSTLWNLQLNTGISLYKTFRPFATDKPRRRSLSSFVFGVLAVVGGITLLPVILPLSIGALACAFGLTIGLVSLVFSLSIVALLLGFGLAIGSVLAIPAINLYYEMNDVDRRGIEQSGWTVVEFEKRPLFGFINSDKRWDWNLEYSVKIENGEKLLEFDSNGKHKVVLVDAKGQEHKEIKIENKWVQENIINLFKRVAIKVRNEVKEKSIRDNNGWVSLEKNWFWFRYRIPVNVNSIY